MFNYFDKKKMFNYYNLLTHIFIDCILFKLKLYLFLDFLKYVCILLGIDGQNDKVIWKLSNYLRYFPKKNYFFQKFWGGPGPPWSSSGSAIELRWTQPILSQPNLMVRAGFSCVGSYNHYYFWSLYWIGFRLTLVTWVNKFEILFKFVSVIYFDILRLCFYKTRKKKCSFV